MTPAEALAFVRACAEARRVVFSAHADERISQRVGRGGRVHVLAALRSARTCEPSESRWRLVGSDLDGDDLTVVVAIQDWVVVVTVF
jgi:hypothetical protein